MTYRRLAEMLRLEPAGVPVTVEPDGSVLLQLRSKSIDLGRLPKGMVDQKFHERPKGDRFRSSALFRLGGRVHKIPSKRVLGRAGVALLLAALFLCHSRQPIRRGAEIEGAAA
jgi:hypothetical protein